ncbi:hypothetical protein KY348_06860 [Candidatus Woesearchaeota archaeon]|nr:hypothetical protein [Candidatus Woesearchaeota archaeon]
MQVLTNAFNTLYSGLGELERRTGQLFDYIDNSYNIFRKEYESLKEKYEGIRTDFDEAYAAAENFCEKAEKAYAGVRNIYLRGKAFVGGMFSRIKNIFCNDKKNDNNTSNNKNNKNDFSQKNSRQKTNNQSRKKSTLDDVVKDCKHENKNTGKKHMDYSVRIAELYNHGYNTREIIREANTRGYKGINNYNDVTDRVAEGLSHGLAYTRKCYNNAIATRLGAKDKIIQNYLSGKTYKEIKQNLKKNTNGMNISDSSILRIMHEYENKAGRKVVGKRNGKGRRNDKLFK